MHLSVARRDIRNILSFEKDFPGTKVVKLEQNYRSCANILKAAHSVIRSNRGRKDKKLWTEAPDGAKIMYRRLDTERRRRRMWLTRLTV